MHYEPKMGFCMGYGDMALGYCYFHSPYLLMHSPFIFLNPKLPWEYTPLSLCQLGESLCNCRLHSSTETELQKPPSSKYKELDGLLGAQIYKKHQCVWLGTLNTKKRLRWLRTLPWSTSRSRNINFLLINMVSNNFESAVVMRWKITNPFLWLEKYSLVPHYQ